MLHKRANKTFNIEPLSRIIVFKLLIKIDLSPLIEVFLPTIPQLPRRHYPEVASVVSSKRNNIDCRRKASKLNLHSYFIAIKLISLSQARAKRVIIVELGRNVQHPIAQCKLQCVQIPQC